MASLIGKGLALRNAAPVPMTGTGRGSMIVSYLTTGLGDDEAKLRAYATSGTVNANVSLLASSTAKPEWRLYRKLKTDGRVRYSTASEGSDQRTEVLQHAALNVLNKPATFMAAGRELVAWTRFSLFEISGIWLELVGKATWVVDYDPRSNVPVGLWPVRPDRIELVPDPGPNYIKGYVYTAPDGSEKIPLRPDEVIMARYPNPLDPYDGIGPVQSVLTEIEGNRYAGEWNRNFFLNSARPDGVLSADHRIEDEEWDEITERWRESHRGVGRAHRIAVLEGVTWVPTSTSVKDMDFVNLRTDSRDAIRESMGMHKVMTGVTDDVNRANAQTGEEVFANWKVVPRLDRWRDVLNFQFLPLFGSAGDSVEFDYIYPLPANREQDNAELKEKSTAVQRLVASGYDPHSVLEVVGLPDMDVVEQATQQPALPPGWVAGQPAPAGDSGDASDNGDNSDSDTPAVNQWLLPIIAKKDTKAKVLKQLADDYPPQAMAWAHHASWSGPVTLPADHFTPDMKWMDRVDPNHVSDFVADIRAGKKLKPVIAVKTPGGQKPKLADGHHRFKADVDEGKPVRAWIATVSSEHGPWETMHDQQIPPPRDMTNRARKVPKASVNYRGGTSAQHCGNCDMFHPATGTCDLVRGEIEPGQVCDRWTPAKDMEYRLRKVLGNGHQPIEIEAIRDMAGRH